MANTIVKGYKALVAEADAVVTAVSAHEARLFCGDDSYAFIDIRDIRELRRDGKIPNAFSCPRGMLEFWVDPESPYHKPIFQEDRTLVFYCASGWRSALAAKTVQEMGLSRILHIDGGFTAWREAGGDVETLEKPGK